jgi:hypothetical protein
MNMAEQRKRWFVELNHIIFVTALTPVAMRQTIGSIENHYHPPFRCFKCRPVRLWWLHLSIEILYSTTAATIARLAAGAAHCAGQIRIQFPPTLSQSRMLVTRYTTSTLTPTYEVFKITNEENESDHKW